MFKVQFIKWVTAVVFSVILFALLVQPLHVLAKTDGTTHDLARARVMDRAILAVMEDYYDPSRMVPVKMFEGALKAISTMVAEVIVSQRKNGSWIIKLPAAQMRVSAGQVNSPWGVSRSMRKVFAFLTQNLPRDDERDYLRIEYAAVNGVLATLDPHTSAMDPDEWNELRMSTQGTFEGIGIRITTDYRAPCDGELTVVDVFEGTPADKAGLRAGDKIIRIEQDSTVNITTNEAAEQLRGRPGTKVHIKVKRADGKVRSMEIVRGRIPIKSVTWKMLDGKVGYIKLDSFGQGSYDEMVDALASLREQEMVGLVLDLRNNPGGLLDAAVEIADMFVSHGTIVTTAGRNIEDREVRDATSEGTEPNYPMVALVNEYTASAGEILSGVLRHHHRALLVGARTFGKGSVQNLLQLPDGGAMRLTIQQYLLPGDISIQAVGVLPDVSFQPMVVDRSDLAISIRDRAFSEASLDAHLIRATRIERGDRDDVLLVPHFVSPADKRDDLNKRRKCFLREDDRSLSGDKFELWFAARVVSVAQSGQWRQLTDAARQVAREVTGTENNLVSKALAKLGVDWTTSSSDGELVVKETAPPTLTGELSISGSGAAGSQLVLTARVTNNGQTPAYRVRARTKSDNPSLDGLDMVMGKVAPGQTARWTRKVALPKTQSARIDPVTLALFDERGPQGETASVMVSVKERPRPRFVYQWTSEDLGNGNGLFEPGERFKLYFNVTNKGQGVSYKTEVNLSSQSGLDVESGRFVMPPLKPGKSAKGTFVVSAPAKVKKSEVLLTLAFGEWIPMKIPALVPSSQERLAIQLASSVRKPEKASGAVTVAGEKAVAVLAAPVKGARIVGQAAPGSGFEVSLFQDGFFRVGLAGGGYGFIAQSSVVPGNKKGRGQVTGELWGGPEVVIDGARAMTVSGEDVVVQGVARHRAGISDILVFVGDKKVDYRTIESGKTEVPFQFKVKVDKGDERIAVVARHDANTVSSETVFVRRVD